MIDRQKAADLAGRTSDRPYQQSQLPSDNRLFNLRMRFVYIPFFCFKVCSLYLRNCLSFICFFTAKRLKGKYLFFYFFWIFCENSEKWREMTIKLIRRVNVIWRWGSRVYFRGFLGSLPVVDISNFLKGKKCKKSRTLFAMSGFGFFRPNSRTKRKSKTDQYPYRIPFIFEFSCASHTCEKWLILPLSL